METFFLACFAFGALFTIVSVALGLAGHGLAHIGQGHFGFDVAGHHIGNGHAGDLDHGHGVDLSHGNAHPGDSSHAHAGSGHNAALPLLNASSVVGAVTWFGAGGYLLTRLGEWALPAIVLGALVAGALGWYLVARFLRLVLSGERVMDPDDYRLEGTIGQLTVGIPAGGTGEVVFSKAGARRSASARALGREPIGRGSEVVITTFADGFATVQPWGEFMAGHQTQPADNREA